MTKGLAVDYVKNVIEGLQMRFQSQGVRLEEFYVDNCCALRQKLLATFGEHVLGYLSCSTESCKENS